MKDQQVKTFVFSVFSSEEKEQLLNETAKLKLRKKGDNPSKTITHFIQKIILFISKSTCYYLLYHPELISRYTLLVEDD